MILALRTRCTRARNAKAPTRRARKHGEHNSDLPRPSRNVTSLSGTFRGMSFHDWLPPTPQIRRGRLASLARTHTWSYSASPHAGLFLDRTLTNRKQQRRRRANITSLRQQTEAPTVRSTSGSLFLLDCELFVGFAKAARFH